ncbi:baseplate wedge subunit [Serratia phage 2050H1]|uniref:Baseplate wedge subunit n=1 Tax=Serratia phage 2050H1 TaxID=2024250 RepID=A0A249Y2A2_9CAUD|nr:baseplate wedge subunit [Serratia phage 2050H1]
MAKQSITGLDVRALEYLIKQRMKADPTFKDYDFEGAGLSAIIRLLSMDTNTKAFLLNMVSGEGHLQTAQQRVNAALSSQFLSYTPSNYKAAYLYADIKVTPYDSTTAPAQLVLDRKAMFIGVKDNKSYNFTVDNPVQTTLVDGSYLFKDVMLVQGNWMYKTYTVEGSAISPYVVPSKDADIDRMHVQVQASETSDSFVTFNRYQTAFDLGQTSNLYYVELGIDGYYSIEFGDGFISRRVEDRNVVYLQYLVSQGSLGNDITSITSASSIGGFSQIDVTITSERSKGGSDPETIESMQRMAPLAYQAQGAAVAETDYAVLLKRLFPSVAQARAYGGETLEMPAPGYVYIAAIPTVGDAFTAEEKADMEKALDKYNVGSITPRIVDADVYLINVNTLVFWDPTTTVYSDEQIKELVSEKVKAWGKSNLEGFSEIFDKQILENAITKFDRSIISNITDVRYGKVFSPTPGIAETFSFSFSRTLKAGSVYISGFKPLPAEVDFTYYIKDVNGNLAMYKVSNESGNSFFVQNVGVVDYAKGVITLNNFVVSKFDDGGVTLSVAPEGDNQNLASVQNQILRIGSVQVNTEVRYVGS